jgi:pimeloyl-ACP methyl ester carboxylesterase
MDVGAMRSPEVHYAQSGDVHVAYQTFGSGPIDLVFVPGWISHLDLWWDSPITASWFERLAAFSRVILFDKRSTGLSDRVGGLPSMDQRMDDIRAVMDAAGSKRAAVLGVSEGGSLAALFAASHPNQCQALVLYGAFAKFTSWFPTQNDLDAFFKYVREKWGSGESMPKSSPSLRDDQHYRLWWARRERAAASPSAAVELMQMNSQIDISAILPSVHVPTLVIHRTHDPFINISGGRQLADLIPNAQLYEAPGIDHAPWCGEGVDVVAERIQEFLTGSKPSASLDRVLATIVFTDIVSSTKKGLNLSAIGDGKHCSVRMTILSVRSSSASEVTRLRAWAMVFLQHSTVPHELCTVRCQLSKRSGRWE